MSGFEPRALPQQAGALQLVAIVVYRHRIHADLNSDPPLSFDADPDPIPIVTQENLIFFTCILSSVSLHCFIFLISV